MIAGKMPAGITPMQVADQIDVHRSCAAARSQAAQARGLTRQWNSEFRATVGDLLLMSIPRQVLRGPRSAALTELALFRRDARAEHQEKRWNI